MNKYLLFAFLIIFGLTKCENLNKNKSSEFDCNSSDIEKIDSCLVGKTIKYAIEKLKIDTSQFYAFDEPPLILRGIKINIGDSCLIELYTEKTSIIDKDNIGFRNEYLYIRDKNIIGLTWRKTNVKRYNRIMKK